MYVSLEHVRWGDENWGIRYRKRGEEKEEKKREEKNQRVCGTGLPIYALL